MQQEGKMINKKDEEKMELKTGYGGKVVLK